MAPTVPIEFTGQKATAKCLISQRMGKSRKFSSKGPSTGFVADYRHAVETMGESQGFGGSGRVDAEVIPSDDSCGPTRKCISLNLEGSGAFGVPIEKLALANLSRSERKEVKARLKKELEQVRELQRRIASLSSNVVVPMSPPSDVRSYSEGQRKPTIVGSFPGTNHTMPQNGKKRGGPAARNGAKSKKPPFGRPDFANTAALASSSTAVLMKQCETLLNRLMSHQYSWVFNTPVNVEELNIPDYFTVIKHPMDLGTVKRELMSGAYSSLLDFAADVRLTFSNAMTYNPPDNDVHIMAGILSKYFETRWKSIEKKIPPANTMDSKSFYNNAYREPEIGIEMPPLKKKKITPNPNEALPALPAPPVPEPDKHVMPDVEKLKLKLSADLEALLGELPETIVDFLKEQSSGADQTGEDEIEIDIDALSHDTLFTLRKLVDDYLLEKERKQTEDEPRKMEIHNDSGVSNSPAPPGIGNEAVDEDVDIIGGNDPPVTSFPPLEIEKDATNRNSKFSSSSSSSSESGSSSSDSDSANSSGSESDAAKASKLEILPNVENEVRDSAFGNPDNGNGATHRENHDEQNSPPRAEADVHHEEENAPSERQVSPEKLYRVAVLKKRFADTIVKAQEKTFGKGEKQDPEKLQMEREELERRAREEKARLQAEARAAEEAWKEAEAIAAAEAKKKRELERELARQALQKMEKTVDINENSQFMEDLEMLRTADGETLPSFLEEASPDHSENNLGSFKFQRSGNPLEQLGLYMKVDDEDEEDENEPPQNAPKPTNDVEEGEID